ncbi:hypothetical protein KPL74_08890 [Bacillus sp. NP157]|nr:hypothetical protein KPL74_08890 [Bacillus sp. NP157]
MIFYQPRTMAYFSKLGLRLTTHSIRRAGRGIDVWRLEKGRRVYRINGKGNFASLDALMLAFYCMQPVFEHRYRQFMAFAEASMHWHDHERDGVRAWVISGASAVRPLFLGHEDPRPGEPWARPYFRCTGMNHRVRLLGVYWQDAPPPPLPPTSVTEADLDEPAWQQRALKTARFDTQIPALFFPALLHLLDNVEQVILDGSLAQSTNDASPVRTRL